MKNIRAILTFVIIFTISLVIVRNTKTKERYGIYNGLLVSGVQTQLLSILDSGSRLEDVGMRVAYQLARRSVVKVEVNTSVGSGLIWEISDDGIVIASNRHLLMKDVKAGITFCNGEAADAEIIGYSQQYDVGFLKVDGSDVTKNILRHIYEAVPTEDEYTAGIPVLQIAADLTGVGDNFSTGSILEIAYEPVFNTNVIRTQCYSKAGMSGGGVFDAGGRLLGMLSGGEVADDAAVREAEVSLSLPAALISEEYRVLIGNRG
ncbi:MAG: serine protease [Lachnospiraceae bacterium]|nr:serine protease [Lachnospiraceae bacterium]